jgi:amino acid adenylation domain-containing protein
MTLLSAFAVLLSRYSRQSDIVIGSPIANRTHSQTESLIGFFVNTLVLRLDVTGNPSFEELLQQTKRVALGAYSHQDIPFEQLVEELNPERSLSYSPLFQVMFVLQNAPMSDLELHGLKVTPIETESVISQFDLTLSLVETAHGLTGELEYNTDLFEPITIERMIEHLPVLLSGLVEDPQQCIGELSLLTRAEEHQIQSWNFAAPNVPNDKNIIILFEEQVNKTPDNIAVVFNEQQLTYHELNVKANKLAHYIQSIGVKPEMLVGICLERSPEVVIGMLSILKSGGTYVPVDPTYPDTRIRSMLAESGVEVLLTHSGLTARFKEMNIAKTKVVCLDVEVDDVSQLSAENLTGRVGLDNLAYVIYTSGSTGQPKGVMVEHHTLSGHCREIRSYYQLNSGYRVLQFASFNFDVSLEQVFSALISGASLIIRDDTVWTITDFCQKIIDNKITVVDIPPAYCQQWLRELNRLPEFARNNELKLVIVGGEIMSPEILSLWQQTPLNSIRLINAYGPTETTITTTSFEITDHFEEKKDVHRIPIGRPLANRTAYILDAFKKPVPIGVPGELHVGGSGLARGYLNNPDLTRERFINNPFSEEANSRLYKTGDLACWLPDGNIEFLGRVDDQVKIRGFRIEPGEIEVVLERNPYIRESAVIVNETAKEEKHLVAYVVMLEGYDLQNTELRQFLKERLPDYMIPSFFVEMDLLPVTPGGKVDRKALPAPDKNGNNIRKGYLAPRTILEMQITKIWEDIMEQHPIGVRDNFFELGGHSLMAVRLVTQIEEKKGRTLSLQALFQTPTIEGLATLLNQNTMHEPWSHLVPIQPLGSKSPLFCIHPDGGNVLCYMELAQNLGYDIPLYGLQALGTDDGDEPLMRVEEMAETYLRAIRTVRPGGPYNLAGWSFGGVVAFEMARQLKNQSEEVSLLALIDSSAPGIHENQMEWDDAELLVFLMGEVMSLSVDHLRQLGPDEQLLYVIKEAEKKALFSPDFGLDQARRFLRVIKANNKAYYDFSMKPYCGKIHFFRASEKLPEKYSLPEGDKDHVSIWAKFATGGIEVHEVTGNHRNMMVRPHVQVLADIVKKVMDASIQY